MVQGLELVLGDPVDPQHLVSTLSPSLSMVGLELKPTSSDSQTCDSTITIATTLPYFMGVRLHLCYFLTQARTPWLIDTN